MKIYVASHTLNTAEVRRVQDELRRRGHEITHDWTPTANYDGFAKDSPEWHTFGESCAEADFQGVMSADLVVLLAFEGIKDAFTEMGIALGAGKPVFVAEPHRRRSIFYARCRLFPNVASLLEAL